MAQTPFSLASAAKSHDPGVRKHFVDEFKAVDPTVEKVLQVTTQQDYQEEHQNYTGIGSLMQIDEGERYPEDAPIQAYGTTYTPAKYGGTIPLTWEKGKWDKSGIASPKKMTSAQAKAVSRHIGTQAASLFNNGFNTSFTSLDDAKPLFSTSHPRADAGTAQSNASATGLVFTEANLETGMLAAEQVLDNRGQAVEIFVDTLLVPPALRKEALIVTRSTLRSGTADNDLNSYNPKGEAAMQEFKGSTIDKVIIWKYLANYLGGSDTAWYLLDKTNHKVNWLWGSKPMVGELDTSTGNLNDVVYWKVRYEASKGWDDWYCVWGSKGDGAAYSS